MTKILFDEYGTKWEVLQQGSKLKALNTLINAISEAEGRSIKELIRELEAIEEMSFTEGAAE